MRPTGILVNGHRKGNVVYQALRICMCGFRDCNMHGASNLMSIRNARCRIAIVTANSLGVCDSSRVDTHSMVADVVMLFGQWKPFHPPASHDEELQAMIARAEYKFNRKKPTTIRTAHSQKERDLSTVVRDSVICFDT